MLCVQHLMGVRPEVDALVIRPALIEGIDRMDQTFTLQGSKFSVSIKKTKEGPKALVAGKPFTLDGGGVKLPYPKKGSAVRIEMEVI